MISRRDLISVLAALGARGASQASALDASFQWCSGSPSFKLADVPMGTAKISLQMMDLQAPGYRHGGSEIAYKVASISCGALPSSSYSGPAPPSGQHTYRWTIKALDSGGGVLAETTAEKPFPPN